MKPSTEDMHSMMEVEDGVEAHEAFVELGVLIVEGRIPGGAWAAGRGYGEGPHCAGVGLATPATGGRHDCDPGNSFLCKRAENFRKHMRLLWQNNIPMCIEVLLCSDCPCGTQKAQSPEVANIPSPADLLLEQWMVTMVTKRNPEMPQISVRGLFQAVRSQLHFSQLSAWWSNSKGGMPAHVSYRVTVPGEAFASQFQRQPVEHNFPMAGVARNTAIKVFVRTLPRMEAVPRLVCSLHHGGEQKKLCGKAELEAPGAVGGVGVKSGADGLCVERAVCKPPSDPLLSASLLDPPPSLDLFARRYQSPPRGGSPSMEAPERLLFCRPPGRWRDGSPPSPPLGSQQRRLGRQGLARRRDASAPGTPADCMQDGLWQKVGDELQDPALSGLVDDRMQNPCTRPGKHHCRCAYDEDSEMLPLIHPPSPLVSVLCRQRRNRTSAPAVPSSELLSEEYPTQTIQQPSCSSSPSAKDCSLKPSPSSAATVMGQPAGAVTPCSKPPRATVALPSCSYRAKECSSKAKSLPAATVEASASKVSLEKKMELVGAEEKAPGNKFNLELSRREFEEVLAVLRDRNAPPKTHAQGNPKETQTLSSSLGYDGKPLCCEGKSKTKTFLTSPGTVASSTQAPCVFHATALHTPSTSVAATKLAASSHKADLLMEAILRTSGNHENTLKKSLDEQTAPAPLAMDSSEVVSPVLLEKMVKCKQKQVGARRTSISESCDKCNLSGTNARIGSNIVNINRDKCEGKEMVVKDVMSKSLSSVESGAERTRSDSLKIDDRVVKDRTKGSAVKVLSTTTALPSTPFMPEKVTTSIYVQNTITATKVIGEGAQVLSSKRLETPTQNNNKNHSPKCLSSSLDNIESSSVDQSSAGSKGTTVPSGVLNGEGGARTCRDSDSATKLKQEKKIGGLEVTMEGIWRRNQLEKKIETPKIVIPILDSRLGLLRESLEDAEMQLENGEGHLTDRPVPSARDKARFRRSLDSAASMVFHCRTGLPLTSSPAPVRRGTTCFDFDSSLNSVSAIRSALFETGTTAPSDDALSLSSDDTESEGSARSPCSPGIGLTFTPADRPSWVYYTLAPYSSLLGSFEESVLNGRLEPVSTVQGFTADLGASGSFCPRHVVLPVTVFFYTLGDNDKVSTPYLGHINLGKKGYNVPRSGTIQVTLFNPLGTVVKMFVVMYDLADMPANSQTFLRQRTLYMPASSASARVGDGPPDDAQKWLRYLIHLRFSSSKSGRIYLHTDIRMIIFRKSDLDTATAHGLDMSYELRSFTHGPTNPKFSPRK